jgi:hypothetical protein
MRYGRIRARAQAKAKAKAKAQALPQNWQSLLWSIGMLLSAAALYLASMG